MKKKKLSSEQYKNIYFAGKMIFIFTGFILGCLAGFMIYQETKNLAYALVAANLVNSILTGPIFFLLEQCQKEDDEEDSS